MKKDMVLRWKKVQEKTRTKLVMNFKKKWIPFILEFAQTALRKSSAAEVVSYNRGFSFLSSGFAEGFDEELFSHSWKIQSENYPAINLDKLQLELKKVIKYWKRKDQEDLRPLPDIILYYMKTNSGLFISNGQFSIKPWLDYADTDPTEKICHSVTWLFMRMLDGMPLESIKKCKGCRHYFLHMTKREKEYCTSSCAGQSIQRKKREELKMRPRKYKAFLKKQKERMRRFRAK